MSAEIKYIPLTFVTAASEKERLIRNTILFRHFSRESSEEVELSHYIESTQYGFNASAQDSGDYKFVRISDITDGEIAWDTVPFCDCDAPESYLLKKHDIVVARTGGTTGKSFMVSTPPKNTIYAGYLIRVRANSKTNPLFLSVFLNSYLYWSQITSLNRDEFRPSVNAEKLKALRLPKFDRALQDRIVRLSNDPTDGADSSIRAELDSVLSKRKHHEAIVVELTHQETLLAKLQQAILQEAIQGKLTADLPVRQAGWRADTFLNLSDKRVPEQSDACFAYVLECADGSLYKGFCQNLWERIDRHLAGRGADWTAKNPPVALIHFEQLESLAEAKKREDYFKSGSGREWLKKVHQERRASYEPARQLLHRIQAEKARLIAAKRLRPEKPLPKITPAEIPFEIPKTWEWCRLLDVCEKTGSGSTPSGGKTAYSTTGIPFLRSQNVHDEGLVLDDVAFISKAIHARMEGTIVYPNDLLLNITGGSIGRCAVVTDNIKEANVNQHVAIIRPVIRTTNKFLHAVILSPYFQHKIDGAQTGAGREGLPKNKMDRILIPLPPLSEQAAIVERVGAMQTRVRALAAELAHSRTHAAHLLQAVLQEAFTPAA